jgi:hypothetical protein
MGANLRTSAGLQTFEAIINDNLIYVDKTALLARLIEKGANAFFLARPRRFGKSLTVSALKSIFSGKKELFRGLAIEKKLGEKSFAPRPVIHLDMSKLTTTRDLATFETSLTESVSENGQLLGIEISPGISPVMAFSRLIRGVSQKFGTRAAILIDEYDCPVTDLLDSPDKMDPVRKILSEFYRQLKSHEEHISFVFATGITKFAQVGLYSAFNNPTDISIDPEFGSLTGFTHEEILQYYYNQVKNVAEYQKISENELLGKMQNYYNGFCFDGQTLVYNHFSALQFFQLRKFLNFWFGSGSTEQLIPFLKKLRLTTEDFRKIPVPQDRVLNPYLDRHQDPAVDLFQLGYLSLRPSQSETEFLMDFPNAEVRESLSRGLLFTYFNTASEADKISAGARKAASSRNPAALVDELNLLLPRIPYEDYENALGEPACRRAFFVLFDAAGMEPRAEAHGSLGRSGLAIALDGQAWAIELKLGDDDRDEDRAAQALSQIKGNNYGGEHKHPVLLGLAVNREKRLIAAWKSEGEPISGPTDSNA